MMPPTHAESPPTIVKHVTRPENRTPVCGKKILNVPVTRSAPSRMARISKVRTVCVKGFVNRATGSVATLAAMMVVPVVKSAVTRFPI